MIHELQRTCTVCLNILFSMMEFGSWNNVMKCFPSLCDSTAISVFPSLPGSNDTRDKSSNFPLIPNWTHRDLYVRSYEVSRLRVQTISSCIRIRAPCAMRNNGTKELALSSPELYAV